MKLRIEYVWDAEAGSWGYRVPALGIVGGGRTREEAEADATKAVQFVLEGVPQEFDDGADVEVGYLNVDVQPPTAAAAHKAS
jgi:predicted RNase H-like HicB family nuclease